MARRLSFFSMLLFSGCAMSPAEIGKNVLLPEQTTLSIREPSELPASPLPSNTAPSTVANPLPATAPWQLSLDEAIRIALENAQVVRSLAGFTAVSTGKTIYDVAVTNTTIDQEQARFDPVFSNASLWSHNDPASATFDPLQPGNSIFARAQSDSFRNELGLSQTNVLGGLSSLKLLNTPTRYEASGLPLNPQNPSSLELSYTQPLLQGAGFAVNTAPIVIARLNTERSYFQYKDSVQELVRSVIDGYWKLVQARVIVWAREIQVQQSKEAFDRENARLKNGLSDAGTVSQSRVTYHQFQANLIAAKADVLSREGAFRNLLGLPVNDQRQIIPTSVPASKKLDQDWEGLIKLAEQRRPDIVELKIILEADEVRLMQSQNQALPQLNGVASYRWNGLSGTMPNGASLSSDAGQFADWGLGINFSVPLGLRQGRAQVRQQEFLIARDRVNIEQGLHAAVHELASTMRDLDSAYLQYLAYKEIRSAAEVNLQVQNERFRAGQSIYLNVLLALNDWGNAVASEAQQLLTYNSALALLEKQTGTILETHGLFFAEERFQAAGPLLCRDRLYPYSLPVEGASTLYPGTKEPSENSFELRNPAQRTSPPPLLDTPKQ